MRYIDSPYFEVVIFFSVFAASLIVWNVATWVWRSRQQATAIKRNWRRYKRSRGTRSHHQFRKASNVLGLCLAVAALIVFRGVDLPSIYGPVLGETLAGPVSKVRDGDTIEVNGVAVRLNGVTCDELGTPLGDRARLAMMALVGGERVDCTLNGDTTYDRVVGRCDLSDGRDVGYELIAMGLCGRCDRYDPWRTYAAVQKEAGPFRGSFPGYCF